VPKTALILSTGRTGTQFLARYFDANYSDVVARHEPPPARLLRLAAHAHMRGALSKRRLRALLAWKRRRFDDSIDARLYLESNPFLSGFIGVIDEVYDAPTVVHIVRDPREQVRSSLNHGTASGLKGLANRWLPFWYPDVRRLLAIPHAPSPIERTAGLWAIVNQLLCDAATATPHYHRLRYEELFDATHSGLRALCAILGLEYCESDAQVAPDARMNASRLARMPDWREWSREDCVALDRLCSPLMGELGYGIEPEWRERIARAACDG